MISLRLFFVFALIPVSILVVAHADGILLGGSVPIPYQLSYVKSIVEASTRLPDSSTKPN